MQISHIPRGYEKNSNLCFIVHRCLCFTRMFLTPVLQIDFPPSSSRKYIKYDLVFPVCCQLTHHIIYFFYKFREVSTDDAHKIILGSSTKSCTLDPWPTFLVTDYFDILIHPIPSIVNLSLLEAVAINKFKYAVVTPLIKKLSLDAHEFKNDRPVSGLNFISKTIERVVTKQLKHHLAVNELDNIYQSAYKTGHSMETALLKITDDVKLNLAQNKAAFDSLSGCVHNWFCTYISNRHQYVKVLDSLSDPQPLFLVCISAGFLGPCFLQ